MDSSIEQGGNCPNVFKQKYKVGDLIGCGGFSTVRIATDIQTTCEVAVKILVHETMKIKKMEERGLYYLFGFLHDYVIYLNEFTIGPDHLLFQIT